MGDRCTSSNPKKWYLKTTLLVSADKLFFFNFCFQNLHRGWCARSHKSYIAVRGTAVCKCSLEWYWTTEHVCFSGFPVEGLACLYGTAAHLFCVNLYTYSHLSKHSGKEVTHTLSVPKHFVTRKHRNSGYVITGYCFICWLQQKSLYTIYLNSKLKGLWNLK